MFCEGSDEISFEFSTNSGYTYLEIAPRSMEFDRTKGKFDYAQAKFPQDVAELLQSEIDSESYSVLKQPVPVDLKIQGNPIYRLLWTPDSARFTGSEIHVEFHDPQKFLSRGNVDLRYDNVKTRDIYEEVFEQRESEGPEIFKGIKFTDENQGYEELISRYRGDSRIINKRSERFLDVLQQYRSQDVSEKKKQREGVDNPREAIEKEGVINIIDGHGAVDFENISPLDAIERLNDKFGIETWAAPDGYFWVGTRKGNEVRHLAAPDDSRVWKLSEFNITPPRDPVVRYIVKGGWDEDPSASTAEELVPKIDALNVGTDEFRIEGVAHQPNVSFGQTMMEEADAKKDALEGIAKQKLINKQREQWNGHIEIRPSLSGNEVSELRHVEIGDSIRTVPPESDIQSDDEDSVCSTNINHQLFYIAGVQHGLTGAGNWTTRLDVVPYLSGDLSPVDIETELQYNDPSDRERIEETVWESESHDGFFPEEWEDDVDSVTDEIESDLSSVNEDIQNDLDGVRDFFDVW